MDAIAALDWGAYSHFTFVGGESPWLKSLMVPALLLGGPLGIGLASAVALVPFLLQGDRRGALIGGIALIAGLALTEATHALVPRDRPPDAQNLLGAVGKTRSYPADSVLLFTLAMILLGIAAWRMPTSRALRLAVIALIVALAGWVSFAQMFLAIHFLTDVLGALAGAAMLGWGAYWSMKPRGATGLHSMTEARSDGVDMSGRK